jgi:polyhydroxybutyrate depolymerase
MKQLLLLLAACANQTDPKPSMPSPLVIARPHQTNIPASYHGQSTPLLIFLHGYGQTGLAGDAYFGLSQASESHGFLLAFPDGTVDADGDHFWNATDNCCDLFHSGVDDVAYLNAVIDDMQRQYNVERVYFTGWSNGGFMSHRMACDAAPPSPVCRAPSGTTPASAAPRSQSPSSRSTATWTDRSPTTAGPIFRLLHKL